MKKISRAVFFSVLMALAAGAFRAQQVDVPEPTFMQAPVYSGYQPQYKGRDPFIPLQVSTLNRVSIMELDYHGTLTMGGVPMALFNWRNKPDTRFVLKFRKLYDANGVWVDGVVGDITDKEVVLIQGNQQIPYPRDQRRP
jgi:hypothetical protein